MQKFRFGRIDGSVIGVLGLAPDGTILGSASPNEQTWSMQGGFLNFHGLAGQITTSFNQVSRDGPTRTLIGPFLPQGPAPWHTLSEIRQPGRIHTELLKELYGGDNPLAHADPASADDGYPHTNLQAGLVADILSLYAPKFWLEFGSMLGGSAIRTAEVAKRLRIALDIICVDPFTGDVNMWDWEQPRRRAGKWQFLRLERGRPTIYDRFLGNVAATGHGDIILPLPATTIVGAKLFRRLYDQQRISSLPDVIYLDSAHEPGETLLELAAAWNLLRPGGLLLGDDWSWSAVRNDVLHFAAKSGGDRERLRLLSERQAGSAYEGSVLLMQNGQWAIAK